MSAPLLDPAERHFSRSHQSGTARGKLQSSLSCASVCIRCIWCRKCGNWQAYSTLLNWSTPARARARDRRRQLLKDRLQQWEDFYNYDRPHGPRRRSPYEQLKQTTQHLYRNLIVVSRVPRSICLSGRSWLNLMFRFHIAEASAFDYILTTTVRDPMRFYEITRGHTSLTFRGSWPGSQGS